MQSVGTKLGVLPTVECLLAFAGGVCTTAQKSLISLCLPNQINFEVSVIVSLCSLYIVEEMRNAHISLVTIESFRSSVIELPKP